MAEHERSRAVADVIDTQQVVYARVAQAAVGQFLPQHRSPGAPVGLAMAIAPNGVAVLLGFDDAKVMRDLAAVLVEVADAVDVA